MAPSYYLNQCWNIVNWSLRNELQWNLNQNSNIFIEENPFENVVCEMASICFRFNVLIRQTPVIYVTNPLSCITIAIFQLIATILYLQTYRLPHPAPPHPLPHRASQVNKHFCPCISEGKGGLWNCLLLALYMMYLPLYSGVVSLCTPLQRSWKGGILVSPCPAVRLSVCG